MTGTPTPPDEFTTGELGRRLADLRTDIGKVSDRLAVLPDATDVQNVATAWQSALVSSERRIEIVAESDRRHSQAERAALIRQVDSEISALTTRVKTVETWLTWGTRAVLGAVIAALLALVVVVQPYGG